MKHPRVFGVFFAAALAAVFAFVSPSVALAGTYDISDESASGGYIYLTERGATYNVTSDLSYPIKTRNDNITINFNGHKLELPADSTSNAIEDENSTYGGGYPTCTINDAVIINNGSGEGIHTRNSYFTANNCTVTTQDNYCVSVNINLLAINGGSYTRTSGTGALAYVSTIYHDRYYCGLRINSGTFVAPKGSLMVQRDDAGGVYSPYVCAAGGTFSYPDIATYVEGNAVVRGSDGMWSITNTEAAAQDAYCYVELGYRYYHSDCSGRAYFGKGDGEAAKELADKTGSTVTDITRRVTFDVAGGSPTPKAQDVGRGKTATEPEVPHKVGYKLAGWTNKDTGEPFSFDTPITDDITLVANYEKADDCTVTFDAGEGSFPSGADYTRTVAYDDTAASCEPSEKPVLAGKVFDYWSLNGANRYDFSSTVTSDLVLKPVWKDAVAECDGSYYGSLADAFNAVAGTTGKTVRLLGDVVESASVENAENLTIDLGGHTVSASRSGDTVISAGGCDGLTVKNGRIDATDASGLRIGTCDNITLDHLTINASSEYQMGAYLFQCSGFNINDLEITSSDEDGDALTISRSSGSVNGGSFKGEGGGVGAIVASSDVTFNGATVVGTRQVDEDSPSQAILYLAANITITDGAYTDYLAQLVYPGHDDDDDEEYAPEHDFPSSTISIEGGFFGSADNAANVASGKCLLKRAGGMYEVVGQDEAPSGASAWVDLEGARVWFEDASEARACAERAASAEGSGLASAYNIATYVSRGSAVMTGYVRKGSSLGYMPEGEQVPGYGFAGWYVDGERKDASYVPEGDVTLTAMWSKDGAAPGELDPNPSPVPGADEGSGSDGDAKGQALPPTGDSPRALEGALAACAALAAAGFTLRRRARR